MSDAHRAVEALDTCWSSLDGLMSELGGADWTTRSLCPDWDVRGVIIHLASVETMLAGRAPDSMAESLPFEIVGQAMQEMAELGDAELADRFRSLMATRRSDLDALSDGDFAAPCMTPVGPGTYGRFMDVRAFDHWVHEQDIRIPVGRPGHETGPAAEISVGEIEGSLGYIVGKRIGLPDGRAITFELTGPVHRTMHVAVEGRAKQVDELAAPDVVVTADSLAFARLACGRVEPQAEIDAGTITWSGDDEWGERAARNLRFTM
ncbi:MAG: maleylpyruvate isomerase family mycothiol-dependent enzyme [Actinomycetota bacterium]